MARETVGLIGVGLLGTALAETLLGAGYSVLGYDRSPERGDALASLGGEDAPSARAVALRVDRLLLSLPTSDVVDTVLAEVGPLLRPGMTVVDTTTGEPGRTEALATTLAARGVRFLDATVVGSSEQARTGQAILLVGGERAAFDACADLFRAFSRQAFHLGHNGAGTRMKLVVNLVLGLNRAVLAEGLSFAQACGVDPELALEVLRAGAAYSRVMDTKGRKMLDGDFTPQARLAQHLKDVWLILGEGNRTGAFLPLSQLHRDLLEGLVHAGMGELDNAAIIRAYCASSE